MSNEDFDTEVLAEKLSKLNTSAQSIQSLSQWCVPHRKKARQVVETWDKSFNSSQKEKCISLLYLANDIIQNSKRNGSEFINEFWKVLPKALKHVYGKGDGHGKQVVMRLVNIWEERKVFGSRGHGLKDELIGKDVPLPSITGNVKSSDPIRILKRDANSLRIKLAVGGLPEKILTAFQSVLEENSVEEIALNKFNIVAQQLGKIEEDVESALAQGYQLGSTLESDLQDQENTLLQCISQLESAEANRAVLVTQLKEALHDQEPRLELLRNQLQVARRRIEHASTLRRSIAIPSSSAPVLQTATAVSDLSRSTEPTLSAPPMMSSFASQKATSDEESKKAAVAAIAAKLTASTSSAQMLTSVLSSLVAEEMNGGSKSTGFFPPEKRQKLDNSEPSNTDISNNQSSYFASLQNQSMANLPLVPSTTSSQYAHSAALMAMPYGYGSSPLPPPPPMPIPLARPLPPQQAQPQPQQEQPQQPGTAGGYYHPHGAGFFGQSHQSATASSLPRQ